VDSLVDFNPAEDRIGLNLATFTALPVGSRPGCHWHPSLRFLLVATILISIPPAGANATAGRGQAWWSARKEALRPASVPCPPQPVCLL
jgi:hypothetical protein